MAVSSVIVASNSVSDSVGPRILRGCPVLPMDEDLAKTDKEIALRLFFVHSAVCQRWHVPAV